MRKIALSFLLLITIFLNISSVYATEFPDLSDGKLTEAEILANQTDKGEFIEEETVIASNTSNTSNTSNNSNNTNTSNTTNTEIVSDADYINSEIIGTANMTTTEKVVKKINRKGAELIIMAQAFGKQISILFLVFALIAMAVGALGNPALTGKSLTSAILCIIVYIAIEYAPILGDIALNFART